MVVIICFMGKDDNSMRIVLTIVGKDKVGIIAKVSNILAEHGVYYGGFLQYGFDC